VVTFDDGYTGVFDNAWPLLRKLGLPAMVFIPTGLVGRGEGFWWDHPSITRSETPARRYACLHDLRGDAQAIGEAMFDGPRLTQPVAHPIADWATIARAAATGFELGAHSATHRNLTRIDDDALDWEISESRARLQAECGVAADCFAYPYGISNGRVQDAVRRAGYRVGVTLESGLNAPGADPYALRRINIPASISYAAFKAWLVGLRPTFRREQ
jgi:peptidoglycan/xylan/chitin deacetylase (PgdA/CDA1 family)